jgi:hypothetical protein
VHQVETLHFSLRGIRETDRARVIDTDIDAAEPFHGFRYSSPDLVVGSDIADERQRLTASRFDLARGRVDRAG